MFPYRPNQQNTPFMSATTTVPAPAYIADTSGVTIFYDGKSNTIPKSHVNYEKIVEALRSKNYGALDKLIDVAQAINSFAQGKVKVVNGEVQYNGFALHNVMADRLLDMMKQGFDVKPLAAFMENLLANPSRTAVEELYLFLESGKLPITEDGYFLAYKKVKDNFHDIYTGKFDHSPGKVLEMPRNAVDDKRDNTCSYGFHFCSISYLKSYGAGTGNKVVIVKINPKDVVSIPSDYSNTKGRTCRYEVVGEYTGDWDRGVDVWDDLAVFDEFVECGDYTPATSKAMSAAKELPLRDPTTGRFVKKYSERWYELRDLADQGYQY